MATVYAFQSVFREAMPCLLIFPTGSLQDGQTSTLRGMYSMHSGHFLETKPVGLPESNEAFEVFMSIPSRPLFRERGLDGDLAFAPTSVDPILDHGSLFLTEQSILDTIFFSAKTVGCWCFALF